MTFRVGQKVVCIRNSPVGQECKYSTGEMSTKIQVGAIYTVRDIDTRAVHLHGVACVRVEEVVNPVQMTSVGDWENGYPVTAFRPLTDISVFHEILRTTKAPVNADARCFVGSHEEKSHG